MSDELINDGWREGNDGLWRNDRFGGSYKTENALQRIGSQHGEVTSHKGDAETLVAWVREAADELEKAHKLLDALGVGRTLPDKDDGVECTLAARIAVLDGYYTTQGEGDK